MCSLMSRVHWLETPNDAEDKAAQNTCLISTLLQWAECIDDLLISLLLIQNTMQAHTCTGEQREECVRNFNMAQALCVCVCCDHGQKFTLYILFYNGKNFLEDFKTIAHNACSLVEYHVKGNKSVMIWHEKLSNFLISILSWSILDSFWHPMATDIKCAK